MKKYDSLADLPEIIYTYIELIADEEENAVRLNVEGCLVDDRKSTLLYIWTENDLAMEWQSFFGANSTPSAYESSDFMEHVLIGGDFDYLVVDAKFDPKLKVPDVFDGDQFSLETIESAIRCNTFEDHWPIIKERMIALGHDSAALEWTK